MPAARKLAGSLRRRWPFALIVLAALAETGAGFLPGRVLVPIDLLADTGAWKPDPAARVRVSNRLLSDAVVQFVPWDEQAHREIAAGRFPWTNPYAGRDGRPLFANPQSALLSPFTWPRLVLGLRGWALCAFLRLLAGGVGAYAFARSLAASRAASAGAAFVFMTCGYSIVWGLHPHTNVFPCLPWIALAARRCLERPAPGRLVALSAVCALATAGGHPETLAFGVAAIAAYLALEALERRRSGAPFRWRAAAVTAAAALSGVAWLGVQLVPFVSLAAGSDLAATRSHAASGGLRVFAAAGQLLPGFLGSPLGSELDLTGAVPGSENFNARSQAYVGLLVLIAIAASWRSLAPPYRRGLAVAAAALVVAWRVPPLAAAWAATPVLRWVAREYAAAAVCLFASMAAGAAVESLVRGPARPRLAALLLAAGVALAAAGIAPSTAAGRRALGAAGARAVRILRERGHLRQAPEVYAARMDAYVASARLTALRRLAIPGTLLAAAGWALFRPRRRGAVFAAAAAGELLAFGCGYLPAVPERATPAAAPFVADLRRIPGHERALLAAAPDLYPPNLGTRDAVRDARSYDVLESPAEIAALRRCGYDPATRAFPTPATPEAADCLARLGVGWFLSREPVPGRRRVGGGPPPAPGLYALDAPGAPASPPVRPWEGPSAAGIAVTGLGVAATLLAAAAARDRSPRTRGEPLL